MKMKIEIFANEGYVHELIRSDIERRMTAAQVDYDIHNVDDINAFIAEGLESVPTVRINYRKRFTKSEGQSIPDLVTEVYDYIIQQPLRTIVCPIDFSSHSINALRWAYQLAGTLGMRLQIAHVVFPVTEPQFASPIVIESQMKQSREYLEELSEALTLQSDPIVPVEIRLDVGDAVQRITHYSKELGSGLIVLGTHGASDMVQKLFGSVSSTVAEHAHVPVLLIPPNATYHNPERIIVALHQELLSNGQLNLLIELNNQWKAHINFVYVDDLDHNFSELRDKLVNRLKTEAFPSFSYTIDQLKAGSSSVIESLIEHAHRLNPDMIVLVNRSRSNLRRLFRPGVTRGVVIRTQWPLLVMHEA
jgi:nucleotide-binding universal stress UspA family protein